MENIIRDLASKYFESNQIESIKIFKAKAIITIINATDTNDEALKKDILNISGIEKASIIHTAQKTISAINVSEKWNIKGVKKIIAVASGKGGVGKSTTSVNIALALKNQGLNVAIFDADIYGPSIPTMLGFASAEPITTDGKSLEPFEALGLQAMSIGSLVEKDQPLIWRGSKATNAIQQLLCDTNWKNVDVMVMDMPPGSGDIQITLAQRIDFAGAIIVSTPQDIALIDAIRGVNMFQKMNIKILGIIENMSYYLCEKCGHRADIFGHDGAKNTAKKMNIDFLGEIPLHLSIRENADKGTPIVLSNPDCEHSLAYIDIAKKLTF